MEVSAQSEVLTSNKMVQERAARYSGNKNRALHLAPIASNERKECKGCKEKDSFIKELQAEVYRLQVFYYDHDNALLRF